MIQPECVSVLNFSCLCRKYKSLLEHFGDFPLAEEASDSSIVFGNCDYKLLSSLGVVSFCTSLICFDSLPMFFLCGCIRLPAAVPCLTHRPKRPIS